MKTPPDWYRLAVAAGGEDAELWIYGDIGENWWDEESLTARRLADELAALDVSALTVRINSLGGQVADALAIYNAIRRHRAQVTVEIDGVAYSAASMIAMAGDRVRMAANALLMIHAPWGAAMGNAAEMRRYADVLDTYAEAMTQAYLRDGGPDAATVEAWLKDGEDHYFTAAEALEAGLVDEITRPVDIAARVRDLPLGRYRNPAKAIEEPAMPEPKTPVAQPAEPPTAPQAGAPAGGQNVADIEAAAERRALERERERRAAVRALAEPFVHQSGVPELVEAMLDDPTVDEAAARERILAHLAAGAEPVARPVRVGEDARDKFRAGARAAVLARAGLAADDDRGNEFRGLTLLELARASLERAGAPTRGLDRMSLVAAAFTHTSSDFGALLADVAEKAMLKGYDEAEETFQTWTATGSASDFKPMRRVDLNLFPTLEQVPEGAEYHYGTIGDRGETVQIATYGRMFSITRQAIINDDLDAFSRIPRRMGRAAIRTVGDLVYAILTSNPPMSDGKPLFHADHGNLLAASTITTAAVDKMRVAMATQKDPDGHAAALNIRLARLIVPMALEGQARVVRDAEFEVDPSAKNSRVPNAVRGTFEVVSDARLDAASPTAWYGAASAGMHDVVEVTYLDGQDRPYLEQKEGWTVDGAEFKVRIDAAATPLDFRTLAKNPGA